MKEQRVKWEVALYPYNLSGKRETYPRVRLRGTVDIEQLATEIERYAGVYRRDNIKAILSMAEKVTEKLLIEGFAVSGRLGTLTPSVTGVWNFDRLSPSARAENQAVVRFAMSPHLKESFSDPLFRVTDRRKMGPIFKVRNIDADAEEREYWQADDTLIIDGQFLLMNGDAPERGVYFVDAESGEAVYHLPPEVFQFNTRSRIILRIPDLPAGDYRLRIVSQCTTSPRPLREPQTGETRQSWTVMKE